MEKKHGKMILAGGNDINRMVLAGIFADGYEIIDERDIRALKGRLAVQGDQVAGDELVGGGQKGSYSKQGDEVERILSGREDSKKRIPAKQGQGDEVERILSGREDSLNENLALQKDEVAAVILDLSRLTAAEGRVLKELSDEEVPSRIPVFVMAEGDGDKAERYYELGAVDIIQKPILPYFIRQRVDNVVELFESRRKLSRKVESQGNELLEKAREINTLNLSMIETLASAIESRDEDSGGHVNRISDFTEFFLRKLNDTKKYSFSEEEITTIAEASILHDVGKIAIPDAILKKPGALTADEIETMKTHTMRGGEIVKTIRGFDTYPIFAYACDICLHHHERWDGRGYPDGLKGDEIEIWTQVVALADVYDAMVHGRVYKAATPHGQAIEMIAAGKCGAFNPLLVKLLIKHAEELSGIARLAL